MSTVKNQASDFQWEVAPNGEVVITGLVANETATEIVVLDAIEGRPVTKIGADAFSGRSTLTSVALPIGLKTLGKGAFTGCKALTKFVLSSNAKRLRVVDGVLFSGDGKTLLRYPPGKSGAYAVPRET